VRGYIYVEIQCALNFVHHAMNVYVNQNANENDDDGDDH